MCECVSMYVCMCMRVCVCNTYTRTVPVSVFLETSAEVSKWIDLAWKWTRVVKVRIWSLPSVDDCTPSVGANTHCCGWVKCWNEVSSMHTWCWCVHVKNYQNALCIFQISKHGMFKCFCKHLTVLTSTHPLRVLTHTLHVCMCVMWRNGFQSDQKSLPERCLFRPRVYIRVTFLVILRVFLMIHVQRGLRTRNFRGFVLCKHVCTVFRTIYVTVANLTHLYSRRPYTCMTHRWVVTGMLTDRSLQAVAERTLGGVWKADRVCHLYSDL